MHEPMRIEIPDVVYGTLKVKESSAGNIILEQGAPGMEPLDLILFRASNLDKLIKALRKVKKSIDKRNASKPY